MADYRQRLQRALEHIAAHAHRALTLEDIARAAALSPHHFHRVFRACMDETVGQYTTRKRLELAALRVVYQPDLTITEIALESGYSSHANFSKAFAAHFGCSPSSLREHEWSTNPRVGALTKRYGKHFDPRDLHQAPALPGLDRDPGAQNIPARFETRERRTFVCFMHPNGYDVEGVNATWATFIPMIQQLGLCDDDVDAHAIVHDDPALTPEPRCRYDACIPVASVPRALPEPLFITQIPAGRYALFHYRGPADQTWRMYRNIYARWFPGRAIVPDGPPPIERYTSDGPDEHGIIDIEIAMKVRPTR